MHHRTGFGLARVMMGFAAALAVASVGLGLSGCASHRVSAAPTSSDMAELAGRMTGKFSSRDHAAQAQGFTDARVAIEPIWLNRTGAHWFYVEQWIPGASDRPYRQRIYRLAESEPGVFVIDVYALPDPHKWIGAWKDPSRLSDLDRRDLTIRDGCALTLRRDGAGDFTGGTEGDWCITEIPEASYTTSQVRITAEGIDAWDRAFDVSGAQVWGSTIGPTRFLRVTAE